MQGLFNFISFIMSVVTFISALFTGASCKPDKTAIDLDNFTLVWSDEFDGDEVDKSKWQTQETTEIRRGGYWNGALAEVTDGNLVITSKYLPNGVNEGDPAGWYTAQLSSIDRYEQTYGYFETRCILPEGYGQWAAFWMMNDAMSETYLTGRRGAEIDVFESAYFGTEKPDQVSSAIHWGGYGYGLTSLSPTYTGVQPIDPYHSYNTYGLEWNKNEYIFYVNGEVYAYATRFKTVPSQQPEHLLLSVEMAGENGVPANESTAWAPGTIEDNGRDFVSEFIIDYVRCYQYK